METTTNPSELAKEVLQRIRKYPDTHNQEWWLGIEEDSFTSCDDPGALTVLAQSPSQWEDCGTTACLAGHIVAAGVKLYGAALVEKPITIAGAAMMLMGLSFDDLFDSGMPVQVITDWLERVADGENVNDAAKLVLGLRYR